MLFWSDLKSWQTEVLMLEVKYPQNYRWNSDNSALTLTICEGTTNKEEVLYDIELCQAVRLFIQNQRLMEGWQDFLLKNDGFHEKDHWDNVPAKLLDCKSAGLYYLLMQIFMQKVNTAFFSAVSSQLVWPLYHKVCMFPQCLNCLFGVFSCEPLQISNHTRA